uniref:FAD-binding oxidoreductase/transferase type 4 C-terminal domain-containing protein n=3 Tax=Phaeomonas parva TaxID=124430 RepID=A0A7S1XM30_9STRA|mmetsp:Transcript_20689/g.62948  ORF Transcript_20689/g.62948 Transcript_20689/m.62948 type:complete len:100 (+) Transcript_20689:85-384(+)
MEPYPDARVHVWGHAVDGNIHLNIVTPEAREDVRTALEPWVYDYVAKRGGSISAEHGIGVLKLGAFQNTKAAAAQETMSAVKKLLDPNAILNPGKILRG